MRVSFLAVVALALLVGLGAVVAVKTFGLLTPPAKPAPATPPPVVTLPTAPPQVLVATRPLYENDFIAPGDVGTRPVTELEMKHFKEHQDEYLSPVPNAAYYRFVNGRIPGNKPLMKSDLQPIHKADPLHDRLLPGTRPVKIGRAHV